MSVVSGDYNIEYDSLCKYFGNGCAKFPFLWDQQRKGPDVRNEVLLKRV